MPDASTVKFGLDSGVSQAEISTALSQEKLESIQVAIGICVKSSVTKTKSVIGEPAGGLTTAELTNEERKIS